MRSKLIGVWSMTAVVMCACTAIAGQEDSGAPNAAKAAAERLAREALASELQLDGGAFETLSSEPQTWPDSSLGCGKPGTMAAQVISSGFAFVLKSPRGDHRVHATDRHAVVCDDATQWRGAVPNRNGARPREAVSLRNLNPMVEAARRDLAAKLGVPLETVQSVEFVPAQWPDSSMECPQAGEAVVRAPARGFRIDLRHADRIFSYHTDLNRVRACPAIETK